MARFLRNTILRVFAVASSISIPCISKNSAHAEGIECDNKACQHTMTAFQRALKMQRAVEKENEDIDADTESTPIASTDCPVDIELLGRSTWNILHTIAANYSDEPTESEKAKAFQLIQLLAHFYPCEVCAKDFRDSVSKYPPRVNNRVEFSIYVCQLHNEVNEKLGVKTFPCSIEALDERWKTGSKSCEG